MIRRIALLAGLSAGLIYAAGLFISYRSGISAMAGFLNAYTWIPIALLLVGAGACWLRINVIPVPGLKELLQYAFLAYFIYELCYASATYGLFGWFDPTANDQLVQHLLMETKQKLGDNSSGSQRMEAIKALADTTKGPLTIDQTIKGMAQQLILDFLKSLFIATITKQIIQPKA